METVDVLPAFSDQIESLIWGADDHFSDMHILSTKRRNKVDLHS